MKIYFWFQIAKDFKDDFTFAVANNNDFAHETEEYGLNYVSGDKPVVLAKDAKGLKYLMKEEFSWVILHYYLWYSCLFLNDAG